MMKLATELSAVVGKYLGMFPAGSDVGPLADRPSCVDVVVVVLPFSSCNAIESSKLLVSVGGESAICWVPVFETSGPVIPPTALLLWP